METYSYSPLILKYTCKPTALFMAVLLLMDDSSGGHKLTLSSNLVWGMYKVFLHTIIDTITYINEHINNGEFHLTF